MSIPKHTPSESRANLGAVTETNLAWAEQRHAMLARLAVLGMRLAEEIVERAVSSPYHPEPRHEPGRAYANAARAVRFSLVLQARVEQQIIAIRKGELVPALSSAATTLGEATGGFIAIEESPPRGMTCEAPCAATDRETRETEAAVDARDRSRENLIEGETYDALLNRPMGEGVETICADLGVAFDASLWSDADAATRSDATGAFADAVDPPSRNGRRRGEVAGREPERVNQLE